MKPIEYYSKNPLPYPRKENHTVYFLYKRGEVILKEVPLLDVQLYLNKHSSDLHNGVSLRQVADKLGFILETVDDSNGFKYAKTQYEAENIRLKNEFMLDVFVDNDVTHHPGRHVMFNYAWQEGHSSGLTEVANVFSEVVTLISAVDAARKIEEVQNTVSMHAVWEISWSEHERGWDTKFSHKTYHPTQFAAVDTITDYWDKEKDKNPDKNAVPDFYVAPGDPKLVEITDEEYKIHFKE